MNVATFRFINNLAGKSYLLDAVGKFFGSDYFLYIFVLAIALLWFNKSLRKYVYLALGSALISRVVFVEIIKRIVDHPRPYEAVLGAHQLIADTEHGLSFPSGHAVIYFALAFAFWKTKYFWPLLILAITGSVSRVFVGVHFPADILASAVIAWITVWILKRLFKNYLLS